MSGLAWMNGRASNRATLWRRRASVAGALWMVGAAPGLAFADLEPEEAGGDVRRDAVVEAIERVMPSVVNIATEEIVPVQDPLESLFREFFDPYYRRRPPNAQHSLGSGVIVDEEGYLVTNYHVVARARRIKVKLHDGREFDAEWIAGTSETDVALLRLVTGTNATPLTAVSFAPDDDLLLGETVLALGNPFGLGESVSRGILSSKSRRPPREGEALDLRDWLQTDAAINPGNSGGPLVNLRGELIGINVAVHREGQGIGFAIPVKRVAATIARISSPEALGDVWFGAAVRPGRRPVTILSVEPESPAAQAGLEAGDRILEVEGEAPSGFMDFNRRLLAVEERLAVGLTVERAGRRREVTVRMVPEATVFNAELIRRKTGASVQELTPALARAFGLANVRGLLVAGVDKGSAADDVRLDRGMVITAVDGWSSTDVVETARRMRRKGEGERLVLDVMVPRTRGRFYTLEQVRVELAL